MRRFLLYSLLFLSFVCVLFILYLENGSKHHYCQQPICKMTLTVCNESYYPVDAEKAHRIDDLISAKAHGEMPERSELLSAVTFAPYEDMYGVNGVYCNGAIYVRSSLGGEGKAFVARHELDHAFQAAHVVDPCSNGEYCATLNAALDYPMGFVETVVSSLYLSYTETPDKQCFFFNSWEIFRIYIFPFGR